MKAKLYFIIILLGCLNLFNDAFSQEVNLNANWRFKIDPNQIGLQEQWFSKQVNDASWESVNVPHLWDLQNEYANYIGKAWYRKSFDHRLDLKDKRVFLEIGEVGMSYTLYVDGKKAGDVLAGNYLEEFDITDLLSSDEKHSIALEIDNSLSWGAYWSWGGIRRSVKIITRNPVYIERQEISSALDLGKNEASLQTAVIIKNSSLNGQIVDLGQIITFDGKEVLQRQEKKVFIPPHSEKTVLLSTVLKSNQLKLWHFDRPNLYESKLQLSNSGGPLATIKDKFGVRKIEIKDNQFLLNGEKVRLAGYNWVADDRTSGNILPEFRYKEDIDLMKAAGANLARLSHRPLPKDVMDYLDEVGMLVFSEFNNWPQFMNGSSEEPKLFAKRLIQQNFNHPSIIGWSVGNENGNLKSFPDVNEYTQNIIAYIKKDLDSTRLVTYVSHTADVQDNDAAQYGDIVLINKYGGYEKSVESLSKRYPNKAIFMSEYGGHTQNLIYDTPDKSLFKSLMVDKLPAQKSLIGYAIWTYNDYRSNYQALNPQTTTPLHQNRQWGIVDVYRNKKRAFRQMQNFYAPVSSIHIKTTKFDEKTNKSEIIIEARKLEEIPAYSAKGYQLVWELRGFDNINLQTGLISLKDIYPGDQPTKHAIEWNSANAAFLKVSLLSASGYSVKDTSIYLKAPEVPQIKSVINASQEVRILFDRNEFSTQYKAYYEMDGVVKATAPTIDHYIDFSELLVGKTYKIWLTAMNDFGETKASEPITFIPKNGNLSLPPIIWQTQATNESFSTGYSYNFADAQYRIRYGTDVDKPETWKHINTSIFGMAKVAFLENDKQYYYQISRKAGFAPTFNQWSEIVPVKPMSGEFKQDVLVHGFKQETNTILLSFSPQKSAIAYEVECSTNKGNRSFRINKSAVSLAVLNLPDNVKVLGVNIRAIIKYD